VSRTFALLALVVLGGCLGVPATESVSPTDESTPTAPTPTTDSPASTTESPAPTPTANTPASTNTSTTGTTPVVADCPYHLQVDPASDGATAVDALAYSNLSAARQQEFRRALDNGTASIGTDLPETWSSPRTVEYRGTLYDAVVFVC
jgi:hypothetical protein